MKRCLKWMVAITVVTLLVSASTVGLVIYADQPVIIWKLSHTTPADHPYNLASMRIAEIVKQKTGGKFTIEVCHSGTLGWEREVLEAMQLGKIEMSLPAIGPFAVFVPSFNCFNLPFLYRDVSQMQKAFKSRSMATLKKDAEKYGFICLEIGGPVFRYPMNSIKAINTPDDFKGMKMRTMAVPVHIDTYKAMGAVVNTTAFNELYNAMQLKAVDGCENLLTGLYTMKFYEVSKYLTLLPILNNNATFVVSKKKWDELPRNYQKILRDATAEGIKVLNSKMIEMEDSSLEQMKKQGVFVNKVPDLAPFIKITEPVKQKYMKDMAPWVAKIVDEISKIK